MIPTYCDQCGAELDGWAFEGRKRKWCPSCDRPVFRNAVPCAGVTVVDGDRVLLVERTAEPGIGDWSIPAGHLEVDEEPRVGAVRELEEETGLTVNPAALALLEAAQLETVSEKHVVSVGYAARSVDAAGTPEAGSDAGAVEWVAVDELDERSLRPHVERRVAAALGALSD